MIKIKVRKYCCLNNLGSIVLNEHKRKRKNMSAYNSIKWQKHMKPYLLIENSAEDQNN